MEQEKEQVLSMPVIVHEAEVYRSDRKNKRLWIAIMLLIGVIAALSITAGNRNDTH